MQGGGTRRGRREELPRSSYAKRDLSRCDPTLSTTQKRDERSRRRERRFARCDDSRREDDECGEQKLSDVREAGSKKAPQIHAINNVSPHT